jgi:hypothetical protein
MRLDGPQNRSGRRGEKTNLASLRTRAPTSWPSSPVASHHADYPVSQKTITFIITAREFQTQERRSVSCGLQRKLLNTTYASMQMQKTAAACSGKCSWCSGDVIKQARGQAVTFDRPHFNLPPSSNHLFHSSTAITCLQQHQ